MHRNTIRTLSAFLLIFAILFSGLQDECAGGRRRKLSSRNYRRHKLQQKLQKDRRSEEAKTEKMPMLKRKKRRLDAIDSLKRNSHDQGWSQS